MHGVHSPSRCYVTGCELLSVVVAGTQPIEMSASGARSLEHVIEVVHALMLTPLLPPAPPHNR
jgi:hypothetical protein